MQVVEQGLLVVFVDLDDDLVQLLVVVGGTGLVVGGQPGSVNDGVV